MHVLSVEPLSMAYAMAFQEEAAVATKTYAEQLAKMRASAPRLHFRCVKVTHEEKRTNRYDEPEAILEQSVTLQFDCVEAARDPRNFHGYLGMTLTLERFQALGYEVGKIYELAPT